MLVGGPATPASASTATATSLGRGWWRQGGGPPGLSGDPPGGWGPMSSEGAFLVPWCWMATLTGGAILQIHDVLAIGENI